MRCQSKLSDHCSSHATADTASPMQREDAGTLRTPSLPPPCSPTPCCQTASRSSSDARRACDLYATLKPGRPGDHARHDGEVVGRGREAVVGDAERARGQISSVSSSPLSIIIVLTPYSAIFCHLQSAKGTRGPPSMSFTTQTRHPNPCRHATRVNQGELRCPHLWYDLRNPRSTHFQQFSTIPAVEPR